MYKNMDLLNKHQAVAKELPILFSPKNQDIGNRV